MKIAKRNPFSGAPVLHTPTLFGATTSQAFLYRIPVTGERPIAITVIGLPEGLTVAGGVLSGKVTEDWQGTVTVIAENAKGKAEKEIKLVIAPDTVQLTPLLGFSTWNAFYSEVSQEKVQKTAKLLLYTGIADYGYGYVNVDSGWQGVYGGPYNAIQPNPKFPDMKAMCDTLHQLGFRAGIYSTPMLTAWGCPEGYESIPGCTVGEPDERFPDACNGGIGKTRLEAENVRQWCEWGFDYVKYDWHPTDGINAHYMKEALKKSGRTFTYCNTVHANIEDADIFKTEVNNWRDNGDAQPFWSNIKERVGTLTRWQDHVSPGHFYDLDMLALGKIKDNPDGKGLTEAEEVLAYTMRAFFCSPIQISAPLDTLSDFELDLFCNDEILAINQDAKADYPRQIPGSFPEGVQVFRRTLENGDTAYCILSIADESTEVNIPLEEPKWVRNVWKRESLGITNLITVQAEPHSAYVYRVKA